MSVVSDRPRTGAGPEAAMAGVPMIVQRAVHLPPQKKIDDFWERFTTKAPGKATTVLPRNELADRLARRAARAAARAAGESRSGGAGSVSSPGTGTGTAAAIAATTSYEAAASLCRAKVAQIVAECRRVNQRYRDPHFDLDYDLRSGSRDCLESLSNLRRHYDDVVEVDYSESDDGYDSGAGPGKGRGGGGRGGGAGGGTGECGRWPGHSLRPKSVKRVSDIFDDPRFYVDGPAANDVRQGRDGDCWLMAALCMLSNKPGLIERVCVARNEEVGVYGFVFHRDGEWVSEIIDDKLYLLKPDYDEARMGMHRNLERKLWDEMDRLDSEENYRKTYQSNSAALYFAQCENPNETWLPLLEKAYAKAHGDYAAIEGGFTGEGIEDLTGGVTTELFTTDILDKEYFWREELLKVNQDFLFGCATGHWGLGYGHRKGIFERHAYSVMRAVEVDGQRLVLIKNPWGKGEWQGPWSDGSKEWTPEWLTKLGHRFGDDGAFWISYKDLLRKYQTFDRTRLFGPEWKVTSVWTMLNVSWSPEYHHTKFSFTLARAGPVVIVLSQLDDRYFRGLQGKYVFGLGFRVHKAGEDDYLVRTHTTYRMRRSCNVELELEAGEYTVLVRIDARRHDWKLPPEDVVRLNVKERREKLLRIGLAYDLAHSKARFVETAEEKGAREAYEKRWQERRRKHIRKIVVEAKRKHLYFKHQDWLDRQKDSRRVRAWEARLRREQAEKREAKRRAKEEEASRQGPELPVEQGPEEEAAKRAEPQEPEALQTEETERRNKSGEEDEVEASRAEGGPGPETEEKDREDQENESLAGPEDKGEKAETGAASQEEGATGGASSEPVKHQEDGDGEQTTAGVVEVTDKGAQPKTAGSEDRTRTSGTKGSPAADQAGPEENQAKRTEASSTLAPATTEGIPDADGKPTEVLLPAEDTQQAPTTAEVAPGATRDEPETLESAATKPAANPELERKLRLALVAVSAVKEELEGLLGEPARAHCGRDNADDANNEDKNHNNNNSHNNKYSNNNADDVKEAGAEDHHPPDQPEHLRSRFPGAHHSSQFQNQDYLLQPQQQQDYFPGFGFGQAGSMDRAGDGNGNGEYDDADGGDDDVSDSDLWSVSDLSDRELDYIVKAHAQQSGREGSNRMDLEEEEGEGEGNRGGAGEPPFPPPSPSPSPPAPPPAQDPSQSREQGLAAAVGLDEFERDPWNAVAVVGLRIYYKVVEEEKEGEEEKAEKEGKRGEKKEGGGGGGGGGGEAEGLVKLRVVRPNRWELNTDGEDDDDGSGSGKDGGSKEEEEKKKSRKKKKKNKDGGEDGEDEADGKDEAQVLDVDDSAKDATVQGGELVG